MHVPSYRRTKLLSSNATSEQTQNSLIRNRLSRLLLGKVADKGKLIAFTFACFHYHEDPNDQKSQTDRNHQKPSNDRNNSKDQVYRNRRDSKKNRLPGVEANKRAAVVGFHRQKNNCRNDGDVGNRSSGSLGQAALLGGYRRGGSACCCIRAAVWTECCVAPGLGVAGWAKHGMRSLANVVLVAASRLILPS